MPDDTSQLGSALTGASWIASLGTPTGSGIVGSVTVPSIRSVITGGKLTPSLTGIATVPSRKHVFPGGALLPSTTDVTVFVQGVDKTAYFQMPITGTLQVGSLGNCQMPLNNAASGGGSLPSWKPSKWDEVAVYLGTYKLFGGYVNTVQRTLYQDNNPLEIYIVNCWTYGAILDRTFVGTHFELYDGALANIIMFKLVSRYLSSRGYIWGGTGGDVGPLFPPFSINWWSFSQICQYVCNKANWNYYVDQFKVLRMFGIASTVRPAPFTLTKSNSVFETLQPTTGGEYYNYIIVRNSQSLGSIWSDVFEGDADGGTGFYAPLTAALTAKPAVYVDTGSGYVAQVVTDPGSYGHPWDFYWLAFGVVRNPALAPLSNTDRVKVSYPSDIDYVVISKDDAQIAIYGEVMKLVEIKDILSLADMQIIADGELAKGIEDITTLDAQTDTPGIEPGQILPVVADPLNQNFMVEQVDFTQLDRQTFRFHVQGSDKNIQRRNSGPALYQRLLSQATQARDRVQTPVGFALWVTVQGQTNPGGTTGIIPGAIRNMPVSGVAVKCTLMFQSATTTPTTTDVIIDVLKNGASIFPAGNPAKMIFPAGATTTQTVFIFTTDPEEFTTDDIITLNCIQTDANAFDGVLEVTVQG